jgi:hypothetical protein
LLADFWRLQDLRLIMPDIIRVEHGERMPANAANASSPERADLKNHANNSSDADEQKHHSGHER